jgi:hypothetical protein
MPSRHRDSCRQLRGRLTVSAPAMDASLPQPAQIAPEQIAQLPYSARIAAATAVTRPTLTSTALVASGATELRGRIDL